MLGKGLESLIPPRDDKNNGLGDSQNEEEKNDGGTFAGEGAPSSGYRNSDAGQIGSKPQDSGPPAEDGAVKDNGSIIPDNSIDEVSVGTVDGKTEEREADELYDAGAGESGMRADEENVIEKSFEKNKKFSRNTEAVFQIEVDKIKPNPHQPRRNFDEQKIGELAASIREFGILQPLVVSKIEREVPYGTEVEYELIAGERRLIAAKKLGLRTVPAIIKTVDFERQGLEMAIIENIQRQDLDPIETARAFAKLQDNFGMTHREIASRLGRSREAVSNALRLLDLPGYIQEAISKGSISESHGRLLLTIGDPGLQKKLFEDLIQGGFTTRELKSKIGHMGSSSDKAKRTAKGENILSPELIAVRDKLTSELGAPVEVVRKGNSGKITIIFYSNEELKNILSKLGGE